MSYVFTVASIVSLFLFSKAFSQCQNGYTPQFNACYQYFNTPLPALNAEERCVQDNGHLVSIHSMQENDYIVGLAGDSPMWTGLNLVNGNYVWKDNSAFDYFNWYQAFPNPAYGTCVDLLPAAQYAGKWINGQCQESKTFMCKTTNGAQSTVGPTSGPNSCPMPNYYSTSGTIQSSGYPNQYGNNLNCDYHLSVTQGTITIQFGSDFSTEQCCDVVTLYDGADSTAKVIARLSGKQGANKQYKSTGSVMLVKFYTDASNTDKGWSAYFSATGQTGQCPDGSAGAQECLAGSCPIGFVCDTAINKCCTTTGTCPNGDAPLGQCVAGECPVNEVCIPATNDCCSSGQGTTASSGACGQNWLYDPTTQYCYQLNVAQNAWDSASGICRANGAELVSVHTSEENSFITTAVIGNNLGTFNYYVWSGLTVSGQTTWSDNSPVNYLDWLPGEPNSNNGQCMAIQSWNPTGWRLVQCTTTLSFICKKPVPH